MDACDVLIVGAGPAGSSCAWALRQAGIDAAIVDKRAFPRDKVCGGWITPQILEELRFDPTEYSRGRIFQPITAFRTSIIGGPEIETAYAAPISYGIRRCEFDEFLLRRSGAPVHENTPLKSLERSDSGWLVNGRFRARLVVGAGGHFCPVARFLGANARAEIAVAAQEAEFEMDSAQRGRCSIQGEVPELYFCSDMLGYGWCFRKQNFLNIGLGRLDPRGLPAHFSALLGFLRRAGKIGSDLPAAAQGHAYLLYAKTTRPLVSDGILLIGDAAGLAYSQSGEGIRPAIESGLLAAQAIVAADRTYTRDRLEVYRTSLMARLGPSSGDWSTAIGRRLPAAVMNAFARVLMATRWFPRRVVLDRWFLHRHQPALDLHFARRSASSHRKSEHDSEVAHFAGRLS
jgi:menaquinone-9 beta-reductase